VKTEARTFKVELNESRENLKKRAPPDWDEDDERVKNDNRTRNFDDETVDATDTKAAPPLCDEIELMNTLFVNVTELDVTVDDEISATDPPFELDALFVK